jgi:hypothetical protein
VDDLSHCKGYCHVFHNITAAKLQLQKQDSKPNLITDNKPHEVKLFVSKSLGVWFRSEKDKCLKIVYAC